MVATPLHLFRCLTNPQFLEDHNYSKYRFIEKLIISHFPNATNPYAHCWKKQGSRSCSRHRTPNGGTPKSHISRSSKMLSGSGSSSILFLSKKSSPTTRQSFFIVDSDTASIHYLRRRTPDSLLYSKKMPLFALHSACLSFLFPLSLTQLPLIRILSTRKSSWNAGPLRTFCPKANLPSTNPL